MDFDPNMPGYFFSDMGDMIRSMACSLDENIAIRSEFYKAIVDGYSPVMEYKFTASEKNTFIMPASS